MRYTAWQNFDRQLGLQRDECHVWLWSLLRVQETVRDWDTLSVPERDTARRFIFAEDRARYVVCHGMVRSILSAYTNCAPANLEIASSSLGKPVLLAEGAGIHFSLSHTSSSAILAVAHFPIGADLEQVRPIESLIAEMHFSQAEQQQLALYTGKDWDRCFFRCWTRKEAILKAEGTGLNVPLASFDVEIAAGREPALLAHRSEAGFTHEWKLHDISPSHEVIAALALPPDVTKVEHFIADSTFIADD